MLVMNLELVLLYYNLWRHVRFFETDTVPIRNENAIGEVSLVTEHCLPCPKKHKITPVFRHFL